MSEVPNNKFKKPNIGLIGLDRVVTAVVADLKDHKIVQVVAKLIAETWANPLQRCMERHMKPTSVVYTNGSA